LSSSPPHPPLQQTTPEWFTWGLRYLFPAHVLNFDPCPDPDLLISCLQLLGKVVESVQKLKAKPNGMNMLKKFLGMEARNAQ